MPTCPQCYAKIIEPPSTLRGDLARCTQCGMYAPRTHLLSDDFVKPPKNPAPWGRVDRCTLIAGDGTQIARVKFNAIWSRLTLVVIAICWNGWVGTALFALAQRGAWSGVAWMSPLALAGLVPAVLAVRGHGPMAEIGRRGNMGWVAWGVAPFAQRQEFDARRVQSIRLGRYPEDDDSFPETAPFTVIEVVLSRNHTQLGCRLRDNELEWMLHESRQMFGCDQEKPGA